MSAHQHGPSPRLGTAIVVVLLVAAVEAVAGRLAGSLALIGDAGHLATDSATLGLAWYAVRRGRRPATARHTYGFHRTGILVAAGNALLLLAVGGALVAEAISRLHHPAAVSPGPVIAVATIALGVNVTLAFLLAKGAHELSTRSALFHVAGDGVASLGVIGAAVVIALTGWVAADAVASLAIAALIAAGAVVLLREAIGILGETAPRGAEGEAVRALILATPGVEDVHDLHVWSLDRSHRALSAHIGVNDQSLGEVTMLLRELERALCDRFGIEHATLQPECPSCAPDGSVYCDMEDRHAVHSGPPQAAHPARD